MNDSLMLASWYDDRDPSGWWLSEKLDGVRCLWDGRCRCLSTRNGNRIAAPAWFTAGLPSGVQLDGELWGGRGTFETTKSTVRKMVPDEGWQGIRFMVFDSPDAPGPFEDRLQRARSAVEGLLHAQVVEHVRCTGLAHLTEFMDMVVAGGGEGVMLREPRSRYDHCRSGSLLKLKRKDVEQAQVIEPVPGKNSVLCLWNGIRFRVSCFGRELRTGDLVDFRFFGCTSKGIPRHAVLI